LRARNGRVLSVLHFFFFLFSSLAFFSLFFFPLSPGSSGCRWCGGAGNPPSSLFFQIPPSFSPHQSKKHKNHEQWALSKPLRSFLSSLFFFSAFFPFFFSPLAPVGEIKLTLLPLSPPLLFFFMPFSFFFFPFLGGSKASG